MSASTALPCVDVRLRVDLADHGLRSRLVQARIEHELAAMLRIARRRNDGPAGQHLGEARHVLLRVDRAHAERMQLEDFAREVLVQPARVDEARDRLRADRARVVEIEQHSRMAGRRQQHVGEAAEHVRADRLALVAAGHAHRRVGRDAEMVRPEPDQPLDESDLGRDRGIEPRLRFAQEDSAAGSPRPRESARRASASMFSMEAPGHGALVGRLLLRDQARLPLLAEVERRGRGLRAPSSARR